MSSDLLRHLQSEMFDIQYVECDGKIHRCGKNRNQWFIAFQNHSISSGEVYYVCTYGDWSQGYTKTYQSNVKLTKEEKAIAKKQMAEASKRHDAEKENLQKETAEEVEKYWNSLPEFGEIPPYAEKKKIPGLFGAKIDGDSLIVPMRDASGKIWSFQKIAPDGSKKFRYGGKITANFHQIGELGSTIRIAEGWATGASVAMATEEGVVVCFNAGNIEPVACALKSKFPEKTILICGDDDLWTERNGEPWNPGREMAEAAAKKVLGKAVFPKFSNLDSRPTDFNDMHNLEGLQAVKDLLSVKVKKYGIFPLGYRGGEFFFTTTDNRQIINLTTFSDTELLKMMPLEYWESAYPGARSPVDWTQAKSDLMKSARARGIFEPMNIRGSGVWMDQGRVVVHMGDHLVVDGEYCEINEIKSRHFYTVSKRMPLIHPNPLSVTEAQLLADICKAFKWRKDRSGILLAGLLVINKVSGALPIRPHAWLTGGSQTGKTTLMERLIYPAMGERCHYCLGGTSEAGVRQTIGADSVPVLMDEFETNGPHTAQHISNCIELMRSAWSDTHGAIAKGSSSGNAIQYKLRFSAIVSSIRVKLNTDADKSRFTVMELAPHKDDAAHWENLNGLLSQFDTEFSERLFARVVTRIPIILANYEALRRKLQVQLGSRVGQQYAMILAGYGVLFEDGPLSQPLIDWLCAQMDSDDEILDSNRQDHEDCWNHLMTHAFTLETDLIRPHKKSLEEIINVPAQAPEYESALQRHGILLDDGGIYLQSSNKELADIFRNTNWFASYIDSLARMPGATKSARKRFFGTTKRALFIPFKPQV